MKNEILHTCQSCGQAGFSARGLQSHRGNKTCQARAAEAKKQAPAVTLLEVLPKSDSSATVSELPQLAEPELSAAQMAAEIKTDIERYERTSKEAAFIALRIGMRLIWIRDNSQYGSLTKFMASHFSSGKGQGKGTRTLERYITIASQFLRDAGLLDKKTHLLTGKALATAAPIVTEQLELFTDPEAKLDGAMKKLVKWVGSRGLADIYRDLEQRTARNTPPPGGKSAKNDFQGGASARPAAATLHSSGLDMETLIAHAQEELKSLNAIHQANAWQNLPDDELNHLNNILTVWSLGIKGILTTRQTNTLKGKK